jgi:mannitol/fructose-specific phosphotransferase system IIA component (Ntr-type)
MKINFRTEYIVPELKSAQGFEAIDELTNHLAAVGAILPEHRSEIAAVIKQRECSMSTGIGCGVALPHALSHSVEETIVAFG